MPVVLNDQTHYRTAEVCRTVGISRNTLFRSLKEGMVTDVECQDWREWGLLTLAQVETVRIKTNNIAAIRQNS